MPLIRFPTVKGLVYTIDLSKIADRANPLVVEAPIRGEIQEPTIIEWGDGTSSTIQTTDSAYPAHTYAAAGIYTVVIRSATGHIPFCAFNNTYDSASEPTYNITYAVISIDHVAGWLGADGFSSLPPYCTRCLNLTYVDTRWAGQSRLDHMFNMFQQCINLEQDIQSFCFDFCAARSASGFNAIFFNCVKLYGSPEGLLDKSTEARSFANMFRYDTKLTPPPFSFWKADGSLNTDKYPYLTANSGQNCYANTSAAMKAQVPTAYGGTMTVS